MFYFRVCVRVCVSENEINSALTEEKQQQQQLTDNSNTIHYS